MTIRLGDKRAEDGGRLGGKEKQVFGTRPERYSAFTVPL